MYPREIQEIGKCFVQTLQRLSIRKKRALVKKLRSTLLFRLTDTTYSQALSHYCLMRVLLPAAFPPWA
tara:strand:+ start:1246 stop:1449 length:204 start_codon:yes stop_codon:yes gene_type:complete